MYANTSFQNVRIILAKVYEDLDSTPLILEFQSTQNGMGHYSRGVVCFHLENLALATDLRDAINAVLKKHKPE